jgi:hypothetical protein
MKTLLVAALITLPCWAWADSPTSPTTSTAPNAQAPQPTQELKVMTERLGLTQAQQDQIAPILVAEAKDRKGIEDNTTLSPQEKHVQTGMIHRVALQEIKAVFTPTQMALIEQGQDHPGTNPTHP